jgi:acetyl-CoA decarbonylase/synthase complex subunit alpha
MGLPNRTRDPIDEIVSDLASGKTPGALILDPDKAGEVAARTAVQVAPTRQKFKTIPSLEEVVEGAKRCTKCNECVRACPQILPIMDAIGAAAKGDTAKLADLYDSCIGCGRCESACKASLKIHSCITKSAERILKEEKYKVRTGRGAIQDTEAS